MHDERSDQTVPLDGRGASPDDRRPARAMAALLSLLAVVLLVVACGGGGKSPGVAQIGSQTSTTTAARQGSDKDVALKFAQCMRQHGVADFPDPNSSGQIAIQASGGPGGSDLDPNSSTFQAAQEACKAYSPEGASPAQKAENRAAMLKYSQCMRSHGISDFPDPTGRGLQIRATPGGDLDPNSPAWQKAQEACKKDMPGGGKGGQFQTKKPG